MLERRDSDFKPLSDASLRSPWVTWNKDRGHLASRRITMCYLEIPWFGSLHIVNAQMICLEWGLRAEYRVSASSCSISEIGITGRAAPSEVAIWA